VVRQAVLPSEELARFFEGACVVHLSDLHVGRIGLREKRLIEALAEIEPDYVFVTGDYIQEKRPPEAALELLARIPAREGIWGVLGNVDYNGRRESCRLCHEGSTGESLRQDSPIRMLRNERIVIERGEKKLTLIGLDETDGINGGPDPEDVLREANGDTPRMVIAHTPFLVSQAAEQGVELYLAGDTHGGQMRAPSWLLERVMPEKIWRYRDGRYAVGSLWLYVNHGVGWSILPIRLGVLPEIVILRFEEEP
jgi:predicted MPP superfamily phosphohydrolase